MRWGTSTPEWLLLADIAAAQIQETGMTIQFSAALQLALALAGVPALASGGQIVHPATLDPTSANASPSSQTYEAASSNDGLLQQQKATPGKEIRTLAVNSVAAASAATAAPATAGLIPGKGVVLKVDRANATVKLDHEPIPALNWPKMTMLFRLKEGALTDQVKEGDTVEFFLEKSGSDYVIVKWRK
jgi:Cu(I)/Ag(I) efflux system periplasmic protein CusF